MLKELQKKETEDIKKAIKKYVLYLNRTMKYLSILERRLVIKEYIVKLVEKIIENLSEEPNE